MDDMMMLDAVERYLRGEMTEEERARFEELRRTHPEVDQLVVEHQIFLRQIDEYADQVQLKNTLQSVHRKLVEEGTISATPVAQSVPVVSFWTRYKRTIGVAASIAGITALAISGLYSSIVGKGSKPVEVKLLSIIKDVESTKQQLRELKTKDGNERIRPASKMDGTGFLIDGKGYLVTNVHVVRSSDSVYVENNKGEYFKAAVVHVNDKTDVAILKIDDKKFIPVKSLPYSISKAPANLGEEVFTLGFPRTEIVYGKGYLSAKTGYNGDTISYQVAIAANPGNSGAPLFNAHGEVIGVISGKQTTADGVVFAVRAKNILSAVEALKKDSNYSRLRTPSYSKVKHLDRVQQIKKMEDCVFVVKSY